MDTKETQLYYTILLALLLVAVIIYYCFYSMIRQQRRTREKDKLHLEQEIFRIEEERSRIAKDLHDDLGPYLSIVAQKLDRMNPYPEQHELKEECIGHVNEVLHKIRLITKNMLPYAAEAGGPVQAVQEFVRRLNDPGINIIVSCQSFPQFTDSQGSHIYRLLKEIINNTLKHSRAGTLSINLDCQPTTFLIKSYDNGIGFRKQDKTNTTGVGLKIMESRVSQLNGKMKIQSIPGKGTSFVISIPL